MLFLTADRYHVTKLYVLEDTQAQGPDKRVVFGSAECLTLDRYRPLAEVEVATASVEHLNFLINACTETMFDAARHGMFGIWADRFDLLRAVVFYREDYPHEHATNPILLSLVCEFACSDEASLLGMNVMVSPPMVDPLPVSPLSVNPLPVDPLPVDPLSVDPLSVDGSGGVPVKA